MGKFQRFFQRRTNRQRIKSIEEQLINMSAQTDELNSDLADLKTAIANANTRVLAKLTDLEAQIVAGASTSDLSSAYWVLCYQTYG